MKDTWETQCSLKREVEELCKKAEHQLSLNSPEALTSAREAVERASRHPDAAVNTRATLILAQALQQHGLLSSSLDAFLKVLTSKDAMGDTQETAFILNRIGILYNTMMQPDKAFAYFNRALQAWRREGNRTGEINTINNIGLIYWKNGELDKAESAFQQALEYHQTQNNLKGIVMAHNNLGALAFERGDNATCEMHHRQALLIEEKQQDFRAQSITLSNLGVLKVEQQNWQQAEDFYARAKSITRQYHFSEEECKVLANLAELYSKTHRFDEAVQTYHTAYQLAIDHDMIRLQTEILEGLSQTSASMGNYQQAYIWSSRYTEKLRETHSLERTRLLVEHATQFDFDVKVTNLRSQADNSYKKYRRFAEASINGIALWDSQLRLIEANPAFFNMFHLTDAAAIGKSYSQLTHYNEQESDIKTMMSVFQSIDALSSYKRHIRIQDTTLSLVFTVFGIEDTVGMLVRDLTELEHERQRYDDILHFPSDNPDPVMRLDSLGYIVFYNQAAQVIVDFWETSLNNLAPRYVLDVSTNALASQRSLTLEEDVYGRYFSMIVHPDIKQQHVNIYGHDTTSLHESMNMLESTLNDKTILIKEIHHRVKNNMQIIMSMLKLQRFNASNDESRLLLQNANNRVKTMAMVHEKVYQAEDIALVDIADYLLSLVGMLKRVYMHEGRQIDIQYDVQIDSLNLNASVPFGLIVNEVVSNALRYAFVGRTDGIVQISLRRNEDDYILVIRDNGRGFSLKKIETETNTMGLLLINALSKQLHGRMTFIHDSGTTFKLIFKNI